MTAQFSICFVAPRAYPLLAGIESQAFAGGSELQQVVLARGLAARGHEVSMVCLDHGQADETEHDGVKVFRAYAPSEGIPIVRFLWPRLTKVWDCLHRANADVYYCRAAGMLAGVVARFGKVHGKRSVFAAAGNPDLCRPTPRIRHAKDRWLYHYGLKNVDRIVVQNEEQRRLCVKNFARQPIELPSAYCLPEFSKKRGTGTHVLWVGKIRKIKRPWKFLDLAQSLPEIRFRMVGGPGVGEEKLFQATRTRAEALANVEFHGFVPYEAIDQHFDAALVFVNTSESEGFPNTFLQAWARAVPTVSFIDCGARTEGIVIGSCVSSQEEMRTTVSNLASNSALRGQEGRQCQIYFEQNHSTATVLDAYEHMFEGLIRQDTGVGMSLDRR